ncbi:alpha/beta hydrolase [Ferrimicrobium sp.]|uniref:alpha/beta fold hydrolase n=1 Tax=Ferrimicrobium sp. TaxID=2926050 RepID=UPI0026383030|nr:alpha/beta hydrolase [Ferrimicrobium sp.]
MPLRRSIHREILNENPSALRLVTIHGAMDRGNSFRQLASLLPSVEVVIWDRAGYARSIEVAPAGVDDHLADLAGVLDEKPALVFGHSLGGTYALWLASLGHPHLLGVSTFESPLPGGAWWGDDWDIDPHEAALGRVPKERSQALAEAFLRRMISDATWERLPERTKALRRAEGSAFILELGQLVDGGVTFDLDSIKVDVVAGISSRPSRHHRVGLAKLVDSVQATTYCVMNSRHGVHLTNPAAIAEIVSQQLLVDEGEEARKTTLQKTTL